MDTILRKPYEISVWDDEQHYIASTGIDTTDLSVATEINRDTYSKTNSSNFYSFSVKEKWNANTQKWIYQIQFRTGFRPTQASQVTITLNIPNGGTQTKTVSSASIDYSYSSTIQATSASGSAYSASGSRLGGSSISIPQRITPTIINEYIKEVKIGVIGTDTMDTPIKAFNPHLISKINGSHIFIFEIYSKYTDENGELVDNPWVTYLAAERKIKLHYDNQWYDFVITQRNETNEKYGIKFSCVDLFINELSKNGYNIELNTDLYNNQGTAQELGAEILKETNWQIAPIEGKTLDNGYVTQSNVIKQYNNEALFICGLPNAITATAMEDNSSITIAAGKTIYICYSSLANNESTFQFFYNENGQYVLSDDGTILNSLHYEVAPISGVNMNTCGISTQYRGDKLVRKQLSKYIPALQKVCLEYSKENISYYVYTETESTSNANLQQLITNNTDLINTVGWSVATNGTTTFDIDENNHLHIVWGNSSSYPLLNSGLYDNRSYFDKGWITGDKLILRIKFTNSAQPTLHSAYIHIYGVDFSERLPFSYISTDNDGYEYYELSFTDEFSYTYEQLATASSIDLEFIAVSHSEDTIEDIQLFKYITDSDGNLVTPDYTENVQKEVLKTIYYVFPKANAINIKKESEIPYSEIQYADAGNPILGYTPVYSPDYAKIRSIEGEKSNCFNLLQEICETFECWIRFYIAHNDLGHIYYHYQKTNDNERIGGKRYYISLGNTNTPVDAQYRLLGDEETYIKANTYEKVYDKYVEILEYISTDNYAGFRRGINLKSINRTINSDNIVTKLIVEPNSNQHADNGFCSIQLSKMNYYGENTLFNFDYYINQRLLDKTALYRDLYDDKGTGGIELLKHLHVLNENSASWIIDEKVYGELVTKLEARIQSLKALATQNEALYQQNRSYYLEQGYLEYTPGDPNDPYDIALHKIIPVAPNVPPINTSDPLSVPESVYNWCIARNTYYKKQNYYEEQLAAAQTKYDVYLGRYNTAVDYLAKLAEQKTVLYREFYTKYNRFLKEGSWIDEDYQDPDLYYLDALGVLYNSAFPKIEYNFSVIDVATLPDYQGYTFKLGDKTYVEDTEFFGWTDNGMPYRQEVIISELDQSLDRPSDNKITVQNYKDGFDTLFQRITASTQSLQYAEGGYARAAAAITTDGRIDSALMNRALSENAGIITNVADQSVVWDNQGITISSPFATNEIVRLVNGGIVLTDDAGKTWTTGITAQGINAKVITTGTLNTNLIRIYSGTKPSFLWDDTGITAYGTIPGSPGEPDTIIQSQYVKYNGDGIVGSQNGLDIFKLTYNGFEFNALNNTNDFVHIGTDLEFIDNYTAKEILLHEQRTGAEYVGKVYDVGQLIINTDNTVICNYDFTNISQLDSIVITFYDASSTLVGSPTIILKSTKIADSITLTIPANAASVNVIGRYHAGNIAFNTTDLFKIALSAKPIIKGGQGNQNNFIVYSDGTLYANNGIFKGRIEAESGYFTGELKAATGTFSGSLSAATGSFSGDITAQNFYIKKTDGTTANILDNTNGIIQNKYLDLGKIKINGTNKYITIASGYDSNDNPTGNYITITDQGITLTGTINWVNSNLGNYSGVLSTEAVTVNCDEYGAVTGTVSNIQTSAYRGTNTLSFNKDAGSDNPGTGKYFCTVTANQCSASVNNNGEIVISNIVSSVSTASVTVTFIFEKTTNTQSKTITISKAYKGLGGYLSNVDKSSITVRCNQSGNVISGLPTTVTTSATYGTTNLTFVANNPAKKQYTATVSGSNCTATISAGSISISNLTADTGTVTVTFTFENSNLTQQRVITLVKSYQGATGPQGDPGDPATIPWTFDTTLVTDYAVSTHVIKANEVNVGGYLYVGRINENGSTDKSAWTLTRTGYLGYATGMAGYDNQGQAIYTSGVALWAMPSGVDGTNVLNNETETQENAAGYVLCTNAGVRLSYGNNQLYVNGTSIYVKKGNNNRIDLADLSSTAKFG